MVVRLLEQFKLIKIDQMKLSIRLVIATILGSFTLVGQFVEKQYFYDTIGGGLDYIHDHIQQEDGIILSGYKGSFTNAVPVILKLDLNGDVIWSTASQYIPDSIPNSKFNIYLLSDNFIYGFSTENSWSVYPRTFWKVNSQTGEISYTIPYSNNVTFESSEPIITDFDDTTFYLKHGNRIQLVAKSTGAILQESLGTYDLQCDKNHNLYGIGSNSITKFNGNNLSQPIWIRNYTEFGLDALHHLYIDDYGDLFVFGRNGGTFSAGNGIVMKINKQTGSKIWVCTVQNLSNTDDTEEDVRIIDFKDAGGRIYATYQHAFTGGGNKKYVTAKINKINGSLIWLSQLGIDNTGFTSPSQGRSALSLDVDCSGNIYQTGYYDSPNYGPGMWGSMKLNGTNGAKLFEFTVSEDTTSSEELSTGLGVFAFGDNVAFLGHGQTDVNSYSVTPLFVKVDSNNGDIVVKKPIGGPLKGFASTLKVARRGNILYMLKQSGISVTVEAFNEQREPIWVYTFVNDSIITYGDQLVLTDNSIVFTAHQPISTGGTNLVITRLNRFTGGLIAQDSMLAEQDDLVPYEIEADESSSYVFAKTIDSLFYSKISSGQISPLSYLDDATNLNGYEGEVNQVLNDNLDSLIVLGANGFLSIQKNSLALQFIEAYSEAAYYTSFNVRNDTLVLSGKTALGEQIITLTQRANWNSIWSNTYASNGAFVKTVFGENDVIYAAGTENGNLNVRRILFSTGIEEWTYSTDNTLYPNAKVLDIAYNPFKNYITIAGLNSPSGNFSNALIQLLSEEGDTIFTWFGNDDLQSKSRANSVVVTADSLVCVGGAYNQFITTYEGFVFYLDSISEPIDYTDINETASESNCIIYPNPATNEVFISGLQSPYSYEIHNLTGDLIQKRNAITDKRIDLSLFASGAYHLYIQTDDRTLFFLLIVV